MAIFEGELGNARFIELAQTFRHHAIVLFLGRARERQIEAKLRASSRAMPLSLAACAAEKKQLCSRFCISSPSVSSTREAAPVCEKTFATFPDPDRAQRRVPSPSANPAVLMFITMLTSAFTFAASPACQYSARRTKLLQNRFGLAECIFCSRRTSNKAFLRAPA